MGIPVLVLGKSGSGKSYSMHNFKQKDFGLVNVLGKTLPFRGKIKYMVTDQYGEIKKALLNAKTDALVIDDAGYLITNMFMNGHGTKKGNAVFEFYSDLATKFWDLIEYIIHQLPEERIVYLFMHEDENDLGMVKPKTIGKMLDDKVCVEGLFTIVLRSVNDNGKYIFRTQSNGFDVAKSPMGMFELEIDNDLKMVNDTIKDYYEFKKEGEIKNEEN